MSQILTLELSDKIAIPSVSFAIAIQQQANNADSSLTIFQPSK